MHNRMKGFYLPIGFVVFGIFLPFVAFAENTLLKYDPNAQEKYYSALQSFRSNEFDDALKQFSEVITNYPATEAAVKAQYMMGEAYSSLNKPEEALLAYKKAVELDPVNDVAWKRLGRLYENQSKYEESIEAYKKAVALMSEKNSPKEEIIPLYEKMGDMATDYKRYEDALKYYNEILLLDKNQRYVNTRSIKNKIASMYESLNRLEDAEKLYRELMNESRDSDYLLHIARILINRKADTEVFDLCVSGMDKYGHNFLYYRGVGIQVEVARYYTDENRVEDWLTFLQKKSGESAKSTYAYALIAGTYDAKKDRDNAARYYEVALQNAPAGEKYASLRAGLLKMAASSYMDASKYAKAVELFSELSKINRIGYFNTDWISEQLAVCYLKNGELEKADTIISDLRKKNPDAFNKDRYRNEYFKVYIGRGNYDAAIDIMIDQVNAIKEMSDQYTPFGYMQQFVRECESLGKLDGLFLSLENRIQTEPNNAVLWLILAECYEIQMKYKDAVVCYEKLQLLLPQDTNVCKALDRLYGFAADDSQKRTGCYEKIIEFEPDNPDNVSYYLSLASSYLYTAKPNESLKTLEKLLAKHEIKNADDMRSIAYIYQTLKMYKEAISFYQKAIEQGVYDPMDCKISLGECYYKMGDLEKAKELFEEVIASGYENRKEDVMAMLWNITHPQSPKIREYLPVEQVYAGADLNRNVNTAKASYDKMVSEYKNLSDDEKVLKKQEIAATGMYVARKLVEDCRAAEALKVLEQLLTMIPNRYDIYNAIGDIYYYNIAKGTDKAIGLYKKALQQKADDIHALLYLGYAYERIGDYKNAAKYYTEIVNSKDVNPFWYKQAEMRFKTLELIKEKQLIKDWMVLGPFNNKDGKGFETAYPPEQEINLDTTYKGKNNLDIRWVRPYKGEYGYTDLDKIFSPHNDKGTAYAMLYVVSPENKKVQIRAGSKDTITIWLNGKVICNERSGHWITLDQHIVATELTKGNNLVLVKVCRDAKDWGFYFRVTEIDGKPTGVLKYVIPTK